MGLAGISSSPPRSMIIMPGAMGAPAGSSFGVQQAIVYKQPRQHAATHGRPAPSCMNTAQGGQQNFIGHPGGSLFAPSAIVNNCDLRAICRMRGGQSDSSWVCAGAWGTAEGGGGLTTKHCALAQALVAKPLCDVRAGGSCGVYQHTGCREGLPLLRQLHNETNKRVRMKVLPSTRQAMGPFKGSLGGP